MLEFLTDYARALISLLTTGPLTMEEYTDMVALCDGETWTESDEPQQKVSKRASDMFKRYRDRVPEVSDRAHHLLGIEDMVSCNHKEIAADKYDPVNNPKGKINLCTAENNMCEDLLAEKMKKAEMWKPQFPHMFHYPTPGGYDKAKDALVPYIDKFFHAKVERDNLVLAPGCTAAYDMIAFCTCDPGDRVLCAAPYYGRIMNDFTERGGADVISVPFRNAYDPKIEVDDFNRVYLEHTAKGEQIKAMILVNPQNPHGNVFPKEQIIAICNWASEHNVAVVIDEIFASSVYTDEDKFESFLSFRKSLTKPDNVIWMWGFSKDLCMPGAKFAAVHCENKRVTDCLKRLENMQPCAPLVQDFLINFLSDLDWLESFHKKNVKRLAEHCEIAKSALTKMGISTVPCTAAFYLYCDFREYLTDKSFAAEHTFFRKLCAEGVYITPGKFFADSEPGWFRIVFSLDKDMLIEALSRIEKALKKIGKHPTK